MSRLIIDSAGVIVAKRDLTCCYDSLGNKYEIPLYCFGPPVNVVPDPAGTEGDAAAAAPPPATPPSNPETFQMEVDTP